jgi:hypothetical protein
VDGMAATRRRINGISGGHAASMGARFIPDNPRSSILSRAGRARSTATHPSPSRRQMWGGGGTPPSRVRRGREAMPVTVKAV